MRALVMNGPWDLTVEQLPDPEAGPGQVLIDVIATGICGSDFHGFSGENGRRHPGQVMGHETVGRIAAIGEGVTEVAPDTLVTINPVLSCDDCAACRAGAEQSCPTRTVVGVTPGITSAFADQLVIRASNVVPLPAGLQPELGALVEPLAVGYHAAVRGRCAPGDRVLVIGGGPIGQACLLGARRLGVQSCAVSDPSPARRELCEGLGFAAIDPATADLAGLAETVLGGRPTVVLDAVGLSATLADAFDASAFGARVVLVGMGSPALSVEAFKVSTEEREVIGSFCYSRQHFADTAEWVGKSADQLVGLIDGRTDFAGARQAFTDLANGTSHASKILVLTGGDAR